MGNMDLYIKLKSVPVEAQKEIKGGRLKGFTDINPMWRIKALTEQFGPCGFGWYYKITDQWIECGAGEEKAAFVNIELYVKQEGEWSKPICGTGGASLVAMESKTDWDTKEKSITPYLSDECFKMALTDAISVAGKALGMAAEIYYAKDRSKYDCDDEKKPDSPTTAKTPLKIDSAPETDKVPVKADGALQLQFNALINDMQTQGLIDGASNWDKALPILRQLKADGKISHSTPYNKNKEFVWSKADMDTIAVEIQELPF